MDPANAPSHRCASGAADLGGQTIRTPVARCRHGGNLRLPLFLAMALLLAFRPLAAQEGVPSRDAPPSDPLAFAAEVGLNQAWYIQHGYADPGASLPPIDLAQYGRPAGAPQPMPSVAVHDIDLASNIPSATTFDHHVYLPLVQRALVEGRALWVTRWDYSTPADVQNIAANAAAAGFNMLLFQVRGTADAFYTPGLEPWAARLSGTLGKNPGWDPLQTAVAAAHAHGLEIHAYVNVYPVWLGSTAPLSKTAPEHLFWTLSYRYTWDDWRLVSNTGVTQTLSATHYLWATPALTDVTDRVVAVTADLVTRYDIDGIHLDLVRYAGPQYSYDPFSNAGYLSALAVEPGLTRAEWQRRQVTGLVNRVYSQVIPLRPGLRLSAAVWPVYRDYWGWGYSQGYGDYYQDSQGWMQAGVIDTIMPMIYPADAANPAVFTQAQFTLLASDFLAHAGGRHVFPGIGAGYTDFNEIAQRIAIARDLGAPGHAIFPARLVAQNGYWDEFAVGPYAAPAAVPPMPWRP